VEKRGEGPRAHRKDNASKRSVKPEEEQQRRGTEECAGGKDASDSDGGRRPESSGRTPASAGAIPPLAQLLRGDADNETKAVAEEALEYIRRGIGAKNRAAVAAAKASADMVQDGAAGR
jgi:hypothetical protein